MPSPRLITVLLCSALIAIAACAHPPQQAEPAQPRDGRQAINPLTLPGTGMNGDLGAKITAAFASMPSTGGTVHIPAGNFHFAIPIRLTRPGQHLSCDAGTVLHYTGGNDAIVVNTAAAGGANLTIDGEGGCHLIGNAAAESGIHLMPGNMFVIRGMRIDGFSNGIELSGANTVQIQMNTISGNRHGIDMVTVPHYAPNAVHVSDNEISSNDWGVYSRNGHVPATRGLANVYRDNVLEGNRTGDIYLGWDAHTIVEGNYFESNGTAVAAGLGGDNVFDIHVIRNYFTVNGPGGYRSEIELGYGVGFFIEGNYEEGISAGAGSGCAVNAMPGPHGGTREVVLQNAFLRASEGKTSARDLCFQGKSTIPREVLGVTRLSGDLEAAGDAPLPGTTPGAPASPTLARITSTETAVHVGDPCSPEGNLLIATPSGHPAGLYFCTGGRWQAAVQPRP
jgi:Periplasmic copper-binding protein (NosD)